MECKPITLEFRGQFYPLSTTLRVAYEVQGQHNHKPYTQVFEGMGDMKVEEQIGIIWASFKCANKEFIASTGMTKQAFTDEIMDTCNLKDLMDLLEKVVGGIMGEDLSEKKKKDKDVSSDSDDSADATEGN